MSTSASSEQISSLLKQLNDRTAAFQAENGEKERVAALKAAQDLVWALQTPQESIVNITYTVRMPGQCIGRQHLISNDWGSPLTSCVSGSPSSWTSSRRCLRRTVR